MASAATFVEDPVLMATWASFNAQVAAGNHQIVLPDTLPSSIITEIQNRYSELISGPITVAADPTLSIIRFMPYMAMMSTPDLDEDSSRAMKIKSKVPRPANAFILYRQHHHPVIKAKYPGIHNNQICKLFGPHSITFVLTFA
jgi:hypothetical protein